MTTVLDFLEDGMLRRTLIALCTASCLFAGTTAHAVPELLQYQGRITDAAGTPRNEPANLTFAIYNVERAGTALWSQTFTNLPLDNGRFSVLLGGEDAPFTPELLAVIEEGDDLFLGLRVGQDPEMTPRQVIASIVYSLRSDLATEAEHAAAADTAEVAREVVGEINSGGLPGLAFRTIPTGPSTPPKTSRSAVSIEITTPTPGYVVVSFGGTMVLKPQGGSVRCFVNAGEQENGTPESTIGYIFGEAPSEPDAVTRYIPFHSQRVFVAEEGTFTYYLNVFNGGALNPLWIEHPSMTATFLPKLYGPADIPPPPAAGPTGSR